MEKKALAYSTDHYKDGDGDDDDDDDDDDDHI